MVFFIGLKEMQRCKILIKAGIRNFEIFVVYLKVYMMKTNIGKTDRLVRITLSLILSVLYFTGTAGGIVGLVLLLIGGALLATAFLQFCGIYALLGISTCKLQKQ
jgi:hypothetical protein